jgi:hypothetical protein
MPGLSFLNTGVTLANFHSDGKEDNDSDMLNNLHSGYFNIGAASRKSRGLIQSGPESWYIEKLSPDITH